MSDATRFAPGWPGLDPRWTTSAKSAVGTSGAPGARVWFTASHGILNELYYPEVDSACTRDVGGIVTADDGYFSEEKRHATHGVEWFSPGVPAFRLFNRCPEERYSIEKRVCTVHRLDAVLQHITFTPGVRATGSERLTVLLSAHLGNHGGGNTAWCGERKGWPTWFAQRDGLALAMAGTAPWRARTVAFAGPEDPWHELRASGRIMREFDRAENGNVVLAGTVDLAACAGAFTLAIAFGPDAATAATRARMALFEPYDANERRYIAPWQEFQQRLYNLDEGAGESEPHLYRASMAIIKSHASTRCDGGIIASLSVPWGNAKGDGDLGGYHLVWPRDMVSSAGALLAAGATDEVRACLRYLAAMQDADGHWAQNFWLNGTPYWTGVQLDETAFPILLTDLARREGALDADDLELLWPMVREAAAYLVQHGPVTEQDRWEEEAGYSPFTLGATIAALLAAADMAEQRGDISGATFLREVADDWNARVEEWTYAPDGPLAQAVGAAGSYVRIGIAASTDGAPPPRGHLHLKNRPDGDADRNAATVVATDALALVRFGLRAASDPRITDTVRVIDAVLRRDTATGPAWLRYNDDGSGEHDDGRPFDGTGVGRAWPLLAGERAHYALAAGDGPEAARLAAVMRAQAGPGGMLPEQIWDADDRPALDLFNGRPTGAAMPLVWAHAEYVKLRRSLRDGRVFDCPPQTVERYVHQRNVPRVMGWRFGTMATSLPVGRVLRCELGAAATVRWTVDEWGSAEQVETVRSPFGVHVAELPTAALEVGAVVRFTFQWHEGARWEGQDFAVRVG